MNFLCEEEWVLNLCTNWVKLPLLAIYLFLHGGAAWWNSISVVCVSFTAWKGREETPDRPPLLVEVALRQVERSQLALGLFSQAGPCPQTSSLVTNSEISFNFGQICIYFQIPGSTPAHEFGRRMDHPAGNGLNAPSPTFQNTRESDFAVSLACSREPDFAGSLVCFICLCFVC